jgi:phosphotransferase system HPr-like phosphotransfer protein
MLYAGAHAVPAAAVEEHVHQFAEAATNTHKQTQASTT